MRFSEATAVPLSLHSLWMFQHTVGVCQRTGIATERAPKHRCSAEPYCPSSSASRWACDCFSSMEQEQRFCLSLQAWVDEELLSSVLFTYMPLSCVHPKKHRKPCANDRGASNSQDSWATTWSYAHSLISHPPLTLHPVICQTFLLCILRK